MADDCKKITCCPPENYGYDIPSEIPNPPPVSEYELSIIVDPLNSGTVTGNGRYSSGLFATITATPMTGFVFDSWSGDFSSFDNPAQVYMDSSKNITANFILQTVNLQIFPLPESAGTISGGGLYAYGDTAIMTAIPSTFFEFVSYSGDANTTDNPANILMDGNKVVMANFDLPIYTLELVINPSEGGSALGAGNYQAGSIAPLNALPSPGWTFDGWTGDVATSDNPTSILMDGDKSVSANFSTTCNPTNILAFLSAPSEDPGPPPIPGSVNISSAFTPFRAGISGRTRRWRIISDESYNITFTGPNPVTIDGTLDVSGLIDPEGSGFYVSNLTFRDYETYADGIYVQVSCIVDGIETWPPNPNISE